MSVVVRATLNFTKNLDQIQQFLGGEGSEAFDELLDRLFGSVATSLARFPEMGYDFLGRKPVSYDAIALIDAIRGRLGAEARVRELVSGDHLILYAVTHGGIYLLTIRHHRQLSYDLGAHWLS